MPKRFSTPPDCGTYSGYDYHVRDEGLAPCDPCRDAMRLHWKQKRIERKNEINILRFKWRQDEKYYHGEHAKRLLKGAIQEPYTYKEVLDTYGHICHLCNTLVDLKAPRQCGTSGWEKGLHIDHVIPLSKGGDDTLQNVRPSHGQCNVIKHARL
jgi:5-methylcytosine-specific restriction endonuclease McrA